MIRTPRKILLEACNTLGARHDSALDSDHALALAVAQELGEAADVAGKHPAFAISFVTHAITSRRHAARFKRENP